MQVHSMHTGHQLWPLQHVQVLLVKEHTKPLINLFLVSIVRQHIRVIVVKKKKLWSRGKVNSQEKKDLSHKLM